MAKWIPPKIDYWDTPRPIGGGDLKRIEGNTQHLKEQIDGVKTRLDPIDGNIQHLAYLLHDGWMEPSDDILFSANTERVVTTRERQVVKSFRIYNPGRYRVKLEAAVGGGPAPYARVLIYVAGVGISGLTDSYKPITIDTPEYAMGPRYITVEATAIVADGYSEIYNYYPRVRNVRLCGRLTLNRPEAGVIID